MMTLAPVTHCLQAQGKVGVRAGVTISRQDFRNSNSEEGIKSKLGADLALVAELGFGPVAISPEIHWMQKGAKISDLNGSIGETVRTFNYLEIPVLFKLRFGVGVGFFLLAGPSFGYLLDGKDKDQDGSTRDIDFDFYKRGEFGGHIGGGVSLGPLKGDIRYMFGLSNIFDDASNLQIKNSAIGAGVSFMF
jgi:hypothetical protein